ncbi:hypothetical protein NUU61_004811 [Penicillium alfredii]|uniref:Uncharacterized protein n=1 Tax=Penicillium alfredii TaxID=1506179 RepID=A0A9W9F8H0_9EURO|nr:uncharacterized protein NUU61_004811 [Penicillium alfredii]KAJ5095455.1 hypothetical protein NUU61_004811 [Penicillium alfredii]
MIVQFATVQLWSAITGTRPGVLLPQNTYLPDNSSLGKRKRTHTFENLPDSVCYRDIKLFYLKDPQSKRDSFAILRVGRKAPMGKEATVPQTYISIDLTLMFLFRTKFFMHGDYQLAYCPIAQIISFAFLDGAFVNTELTPELI